MPKVSMTGRFTCQDGKNDEMDKAVAAQTDALMGDAKVEVYAYNRGEGNQYTFFAVFQSEEAMRNHGQRKKMQEAMEAFMALSDGSPDVLMATPFTANGFSI